MPRNQHFAPSAQDRATCVKQGTDFHELQRRYHYNNKLNSPIVVDNKVIGAVEVSRDITLIQEMAAYCGSSNRVVAKKKAGVISGLTGSLYV